jgi:hypothetical protein
MKKFLLAASIAAISAVSAHAALAGDGHTRIRAEENTQIFLGDSGTRLEIRGDAAGQVIDVERDGDSRIVRANGAEIIIRGRRVFVNGEEIDSDGQNLIIVDGDDVTIEYDEDAEHTIHRQVRAERHARRAEHRAEMLAERAERRAHRDHDNSDHAEHRSWSDLSEQEQEQLREELANAREDIRRAVADLSRAALDSERASLDGDTTYRFEFEELGNHLSETVVLALSGLEEHNFTVSDDWHDLSEDERAEIMAEIEGAHEEIRLAMSNVHIDMEIAREAIDENRHHMRVEIRESARAGRELARAERDLARAARDLARGERQRVRRIHRDDRTEWREGESEHFAGNVRVERGDDGEVRLWINGEEHEASEHIYVDGMRRVERIVDQVGDDEPGIRIEEQADGRRRIWVDGEEQTGDDLVRWLNQLENERLEGGRPTR